MSSDSRLEKIDGGVSITIRKTMPAVIIAAWIGIFYVCHYVFADASFTGGVLDSAMSGLICSLSAFGVLSFLVAKKLERQKAVIILILCLGTDIGINKLLQGFQTANSSMLHYYAWINVTLLGIALCAGILLSSIIKKPSYLIPLAVVAGLADIWSVSFGVTNKIIQSRTAMNFLLFSFPVAGKGILPVIGVTDFIFATMFLSLSSRFDMPVIRTQVLVAASFIISITVAVFGGFGVPILPVMGMLFIIGQYKYIKIVDPKEKREAVYGILIIATALAVVTFVKYLFS